MALRVGSARALKTSFATAGMQSPPQSCGMLPGDLPIEVCYLNEVSARVVKHRDGRSRSFGWLLGERHAKFLQPRVLLLHVPDEEIGRGYPVLMNLLLVVLRGRVVALVGLKDQLHAFRLFGGDYCEPSVFSAPREIHFL